MVFFSAIQIMESSFKKLINRLLFRIIKKLITLYITAKAPYCLKKKHSEKTLRFMTKHEIDYFFLFLFVLQV